MSATYGVMSDLHAHCWSQFSSVDREGRNTRLMDIIREIDRCSQAVLDAGGNQVIFAGDLFHVRGRITPSVFNPVRECLNRWVSEGVYFYGIAGNHDLEGANADELSSAVQMLDCERIRFYHKPAFIAQHAFIPWTIKQDALLAAIGKLADLLPASRSKMDLFIHAGIDGVLSGMPEHGLTADKLADFGFCRVFAGHYHQSKDMGRNVWSIGSPTHQTWSDVGTKAGWLLVSDTEVKWMASHAPSFIDITGDMDPDDLPLIVDGHFVRARIGKATPAEVTQWRTDLTKMGAKGVLIESVPASTSVRTGSFVGKLTSLPATVNDYCTEEKMESEVAGMCQDILADLAA